MTAPRFTIKEGAAIIAPRSGIGGYETCFRVLDARGGIIKSFWKLDEAQQFVDAQMSGSVNGTGSYPNGRDVKLHEPVAPEPALSLELRRMHNGMTAAEYAAGMATVGEYAFGDGWIDEDSAVTERNAVARKAARR